MGWAGHVARMGEGEMRIRLWQGNCEGKKPFGSYRHKWGIILKWVFSK